MVSHFFNSRLKRGLSGPRIYTNYDIIDLYQTYYEILNKLPFPRNQGPVLPLDGDANGPFSNKPDEAWLDPELISDKMEFGHNESQSCSEFIPIGKGVICWLAHQERNKETDNQQGKYKVNDLKLPIDGAASSKENMNILYTCKFHKCIIHCPCSICTDKRENCKFQCKMKKCNICSSQCTEHELKMSRLFNVKTDHFTIVTENLDFFSYAVPHCGIPLNCEDCTKDVIEHQTLHLVFHLRCKFCLQLFKPFENEQIVTVSDFRSAENRVRREDSKTCSSCYLMFNDKAARKKHEYNTHSKIEKKHKCKKCDKSYTNKNALNYHNISKHSDARKHECELCNSTFTTKSNLVKHTKKNHDETSLDNDFECDDCNKIYSTEPNLNRHRKERHHYTQYNLDYVNTDDLIYKCEECDQSFERKSNMIQHRRNVHYKDKIFRCDQCQDTFNWKSAMIQHKKIIHSRKDLIFTCDQCKEIFDRKSKLIQHTAKFHFINQCDKCEKTFLRKSNLTRHKKTIHEK